MKRRMGGAVRQAGGVVVRREGRRLRVLLVKSSDGTSWLFPKGHVEPGESERDAAVREVREEAGVITEAPGTFLGRERFLQGSRLVAVAYYLLRYCRDTATCEERETRWCTPAEATRLLSFEELKVVLRGALAAESPRVSPVGRARRRRRTPSPPD